MGEIRDAETDQASHEKKQRKMGEVTVLKEAAGEEDQRRIIRRLSRIKSRRSFKLRSGSLNSLRLRRVFDLFDKNGDGLITVEEIRQALVLLGLEDDVDVGETDDDELHSMVTSFMRPGHYGLGFEDFEALHTSLNTTFFFDCTSPDDDPELDDQQLQMECDLMEAFKVFDSDGDGFISAAELQQVLSKLGFPEAQQELHHIQLMISSVDHNHDGRVDFSEFKHMMSRTLLLPS